MYPAPGWVQPVSAGVKQLPPLTTSPRWAPGPIPAEAKQKKGPLIAGSRLGSEGCYSSALRCAPMGHRVLRVGGLCFSWLGMCSALLASAGRGGPHWGPLLPVGPRPRAKQGLLQDHLLHSCGRRERWEMCPELISWLSHAGATSVLLPLGVGRGVPGCPQGWQLTSEGSGLHTAGHPPVLHYGSWGAPVCTPAHA